MALLVKHAFQSAIADDPVAQAAGEILPSHWNAPLDVSGALAIADVDGLDDALNAKADIGSGGKFIQVALDFGATFTDKAQTIVNGLSWVTSNSNIVAQVATPIAGDPDEMYLLNFQPIISNLVDGVGFTITLYSTPQARGSYTVNCIGV